MNKLIALIFLVALAACSKNGSGDAAPPKATPPSSACLEGDVDCEYGEGGWAYFDHGGPTSLTPAPGGSFCCPYGTWPIYNQVNGLTCMSQTYFQSYNFQFVFWSWGGAGFTQHSWYNAGGYTSTQYTNPHACHTGAFQSCSQQTPCSIGTCHYAEGSAYGICSQ